jgi:repressor LexA
MTEHGAGSARLDRYSEAAMPESLTPKQNQLLKHIRQHIAQHGWPPTFRELAERFSLSVGAVQDRVAALETKGFLNRTGSHRGLEPSDNPLRIPILGRVGAGGGVIAQEYVEGHVHFRDFLLGTDFLLRVKGDSMIDAGILEGDLVQVRRQPSAEDGDIVVAIVGEEGVVKRLRRVGRAHQAHHSAWHRASGAQPFTQYQLESANPKYPPITMDFQVIGKVMGLVREYGK